MCLDVGITKTNGQSLRKSFEVLNEMFIFNSFCIYIKYGIRIVALSFWYSKFSLRKHPFLLALRRWGRFARRNVCDSAEEIPY